MDVAGQPLFVFSTLALGWSLLLHFTGNESAAASLHLPDEFRPFKRDILSNSAWALMCLGICAAVSLWGFRQELRFVSSFDDDDDHDVGKKKNSDFAVYVSMAMAAVGLGSCFARSLRKRGLAVQVWMALLFVLLAVLFVDVATILLPLQLDSEKSANNSNSYDTCSSSSSGSGGGAFDLTSPNQDSCDAAASASASASPGASASGGPSVKLAALMETLPVLQSLRSIATWFVDVDRIVISVYAHVPYPIVCTFAAPTIAIVLAPQLLPLVLPLQGTPGIQILILTSISDFVVYVTVRRLPRTAAAIFAWTVAIGIALAVADRLKMLLQLRRAKDVLFTLFWGVLCVTTVLLYYTSRKDVTRIAFGHKIDPTAAYSTVCTNSSIDGNCSGTGGAVSTGFFSNIWTIFFTLDDGCEGIIGCTLQWYLHVLSPWTMYTLMDFLLSSIASFLPFEALLIVLLWALASPLLIMWTVRECVRLWMVVFAVTFAVWLVPSNWQPLALLLAWPSIAFLVRCVVQGIGEKDYGGAVTFFMCAVSLCIGYNLR